MKTNAYKLSLAIAMVAGLFAVFIAINMAVNQLRLKEADPLNSATMAELRKELRETPENESLKVEIRNLDLLVRKAYFTSLTFTNAGVWLLLASLAITLIALKIAGDISKRGPDPGKFEAKDESLEYASQAREALVATLAILLVVVVFTLLVTKDPVDFAVEKIAGADDDTQQEIEELQASMHLNWPAFRGQNGVGKAHYTNAPTAWNGKTGENIRWKRPVPRRGFSSPIIWKERLFLTCADKEAREVLCYDTGNGELLWRKEVGVVPGMPPELPEVSEDTTYAASTAVTDGRFVVAIFGTGNIVCFDLEGNKQWARHLVDIENIYGHASSLMIYKDLVFAQIDDDNGGRVFALETETGETAWLAERELMPCWSTPIIADSESGPQLVVAGNPMLMSYNPATGEKLWQQECLGGEVASSPAFAGNIVYMGNEYAKLTALRLGEKVEMVWEAFDELPDVSSPLATEEHVLVATGYGTVNFYNSVSGEKLWTHEFEDGFYSSPILVGDRIYLMDRKGVTHILANAPKFKKIAQCELGEQATTIPAIMDGRVYIRGVQSLFCIGE